MPAYKGTKKLADPSYKVSDKDKNGKTISRRATAEDIARIDRARGQSMSQAAATESERSRGKARHKGADSFLDSQRKKKIQETFDRGKALIRRKINRAKKS